MQCLNPRKIVNPAKYFSRSHAHRFLITIPCGKCAACKKRKHNEWYYRALTEYDSCNKSNGYALFDCLTYDETNVPRLSSIIPCLPHYMDMRIFDFEDVRLFLVRLRMRLKRMGYDPKGRLKYFVASEYGKKNTCRSHYHVIFYVYNSFIPPLLLSRVISDVWTKGRTDGVVYRGNYYVNSRCVISANSAPRVCQYVSKYVMKSTSFERRVDKKINQVMWYFFHNPRCIIDSHLLSSLDGNGVEHCLPLYSFDDSSFYEFMASYEGKLLQRWLRSRISEFHRQSHAFGISALENIDLESLAKTGCLVCRSADSVVMRIALPSYYKRKLFQECVVINGVKLWQNTPLGDWFDNVREKKMIPVVAQQITNKLLRVGVDPDSYDVDALARYSLYKRGRLRATYLWNLKTSDLWYSTKKLWYSYVTAKDLSFFKVRFVSRDFCGNHEIGISSEDALKIPLNLFITKYVYHSSYDDVLDYLDSVDMSDVQCRFDHAEILKEKLASVGLL